MIITTSSIKRVEISLNDEKEINIFHALITAGYQSLLSEAGRAKDGTCLMHGMDGNGDPVADFNIDAIDFFEMARALADKLL